MIEYLEEKVSEDLRAPAPKGPPKPGVRKSAGIFLTDGNKFLACRVFYWYMKVPMFDLPKGGIKAGETTAQAAVREMREETGYIIPNAKNLIPLNKGKFYPNKLGYYKNKLIILFLHYVPKLPPIEQYKCTAMYTHADGRKVPEIIGFQYLKFSEIPRFERTIQPVVKSAARESSVKIQMRSKINNQE